MICKVCNGSTDTELLDLFNEFQLNTYLKRVFDGVVTTKLLDYDVYIRIARKLTNGVEEGFGKEILKAQWGTPDYEMLTALRENVYVFSAAKNYQMQRQISALLTTENGIKPFSQFVQDATPIFEEFNRNYLTTEYKYAIAQGRAASQWIQIERDSDIYDQLQYQTAGDSRVRQQHQLMNNVIRPVNDDFWKRFMPPNGWNCRCTVLQVTGQRNTRLSTVHNKFDITQEEVPSLFRFNAGIEKIVYNYKHPYFKVRKEDKEFALSNFGLELPK